MAESKQDEQPVDAEAGDETPAAPANPFLRRWTSLQDFRPDEDALKDALE